MRRLPVVCSCLLLGAAVGALSEDGDEVIIHLEEPAAKPVPSTILSVRFTNAPLIKVVNYIIEQSGMNVVAASSNLTNRVTVNLEKVESKPALETVLGSSGLLLVEHVPGSGVFTTVRKRPRQIVYRPFSVTVAAADGTYYEIYVRVHHNERPVLVSTGQIKKGSPQNHELAAADWWTSIQVKAPGYRTWEKDVRLLGGDNAKQTFTAILEREHKKPAR